jgi:histidine triad (HIT) family protein
MTHTTASDCVFCKIASGEIPSNKIYENDEIFAFLDIRPNNPGHALVIPKDHFENIYTVPAETWARMQLAVHKLAPAIREAVNADGINIHMNNEPAAGQEVMHCHVHIIPRHNDDGFKLWHGKEISKEEMDKVRSELTRILAA